MIILTGASGYIGSFFRKENNKKIICYSLKKRKNSIKIDNYKNLPKAKILIYLSDPSDIDEYAKLDNVKLKNMIKETKKILDRNKFKKVIYISSNVLFKKKNKRNSNYIFYKKSIENFVLNNKGIVFRISTIVGRPLKKNTLIYKIVHDKSGLKLINKNFVKELLHINDFIKLIKIAVCKTKITGIYAASSNSHFFVKDIYKYFYDRPKNKNLDFNQKLDKNKYVFKTQKIFNWQPEYNAEFLLESI